PWYMRLNPGGTVPTLVHDGKVFPESRDILHHLDTGFPGPELWQGRAERDEIDNWIARLYAVSFRELSYGSPRVRKLGVWINGKRVRNLRQRQKANPELAELYAAKIKDIETFSRNALDAGHMQAAGKALEHTLDRLDATLKLRPLLAGEHYTMADLVWTVGIARLIMLGMAPLENRTALNTWYGRMKSRPSFGTAGVMERFRPSAIARVLWAKFRNRLSGRCG
ncbi:MAG: glutathione S-transferase family protein, partial [Hyphomicrobiales bacterium]